MTWPEALCYGSAMLQLPPAFRVVLQRRTAAKAALLLLSALALFLAAGTISLAQTHLQAGGKAIVFGTGGAGLSVREQPNTRLPAIAILQDGTAVTVVRGPTWSGYIPWYVITGFDGDGSHGWSAGNYLQPEDDTGEAETGEAESAGRMGSTRGGGRDDKSMVALVTGYAIQGRTSSGLPTEWGLVAVDPSVIPLGSKLQIDGFDDVFVAADTGSAVKGNYIDIWFPSYAEASAFGTQARRVTLLDP